MGERGMFPASVQTSGPDVLVTIFDTPLAADSLRLAADLRATGLRVEVYPEALRNGKDLGKAFKYADTRKARFVTVMGQDELTRGEVKIKDLSNRQEAAVARGTAAATLKDRTSDIGDRTSDVGPRTSDTQ
jgi:histidyl-tRNA synthetase